jgi:hypothetical protein
MLRTQEVMAGAMLIKETLLAIIVFLSCVSINVGIKDLATLSTVRAMQ